MNKTPRYSLYWIWSHRKEEDWFVAAENKEEARWAYYDDEPSSHIMCRFICNLPENYVVDGYPHVGLDLLVQLGFTVIHEFIPRIVWKDGKIFQEGRSFESVWRSMYHDNPKGVYIVSLRGTHLSKIGMTANIYDRLKRLRQNNPYEVELKRFFQTSTPRRLERILHDQLATRRYNKEWYILTEEEITYIDDYTNNLLKIKNYASLSNKNIPDLNIDRNTELLDSKFTKIDKRPAHPFDLKYKILPYCTFPELYQNEPKYVQEWAKSYHKKIEKMNWKK